MTGSTQQPSKIRFARFGFMGATTCFTIGITVISYLQTGSIGLKVTNTAAALGAVVYIPAALFIALKGLEGRFDHAGGEIAFLAVQAALWSASSIIAGVTGGPGICHTALYNSGRLANSFPGYRSEISKLVTECKALTVLTALSTLHTVLILLWIALGVYLVYTTASRGGMTKGEGFKLPMWKLSRGEYTQVGASDMGEVNSEVVMATPMKGGYSGYHHNGTIPGYAPVQYTPNNKSRSPVNPFGSTYEVDQAGPFDNPFERTPTRSSRGSRR